MTWRGAAILLACLGLAAAGAASPALLGIGLGLFAIAVLLIAVDSARAPGVRELAVVRDHEQMLSVGRANRILVRVHARRPVRARVRDECAAADTQPVWRMRLPGEREYSVTPHRRGQVELGRTVVRAEGPWRLGWRQRALGEAKAVPVEADIGAVRVYEALARRGQLAELGVRTLRLRTEGTEFERVREAVPDDPLRSINWKATARTGRLMATELMPERAQPVLLCLDHGRLMGVGAGELAKLDHAVNAALLLAHVALRSGDRAGLMSFSDRVSGTLPPRSGAVQLQRFLESVRALRPEEAESDYDAALTHLSRWQTRRSLAVIFTDLMDTDQAGALIRQCARLRRRHLPLVVTVRDPAVVDAARRAPRRGADAYARAVAAGLIADREDALQLLRRSGVETIDADARTLSPRLVNRYLELKRRSRI
ncbi:MAG: DUF58 domain-containing protein [Candidatus Dormibacteraeota bacterium]|nr:DUF58 domain-containing protein [Candidatus Dormibacteraeota bacterium]MBV9525626.1 DUF58 domain-containing protein [Candidatus Dormibacteraeota bacterium]